MLRSSTGHNLGPGTVLFGNAGALSISQIFVTMRVLTLLVLKLVKLSVLVCVQNFVLSS